jgi:serralysin
MSMGKITSSITRTLNGATNFSIGSEQYVWSDFDRVFVDSSVSVTGTFNLTGSSWSISALHFSGLAKANIIDATTGSGRYIGLIDLSNSGGNTVKLGNTFVQRLNGSSGVDTVTTGASSIDTISLGDGNDVVKTGTGYIDRIDMGRGNNSVTVGDSEQGISVIQSGDGQDTFNIGTTEVSFIDSGRGDDTIVTSDMWLGYIDSGRGKDKVTLGNGGAEVVILGRDADFLKLTPLLDVGQLVSVNGGANVSSTADKDSDTIDFSLFNNGLKITLGQAQLLNTGQGLFVINEFENVTGGKGADTLTGDTSVNVLSGGVGNDKLDGGLASDKLTGGAGTDTFIFKTALGAANIDTITDFDPNGETIQLENAVFKALVGTGVMSAVQFHSSTSGTAHDTNDRIIYETDSGKLFYDADGNGAGAAVQFAVLAKNLALGASDFIII